MPVSCAAICVCSARSFGSFGAAGAFLGQFQRAAHGPFIHQRRSRLGIVRNVGFRNPLRARSVRGELQQFSVGTIDKCLRFGCCGRPRISGFLCGGQRRCGSERKDGSNKVNAHGRSIYPVILDPLPLVACVRRSQCALHFANTACSLPVIAYKISRALSSSSSCEESIMS